jgi:hypothetical protein
LGGSIAAESGRQPAGVRRCPFGGTPHNAAARHRGQRDVRVQIADRGGRSKARGARCSSVEEPFTCGVHTSLGIPQKGASVRFAGVAVTPPTLREERTPRVTVISHLPWGHSSSLSRRRPPWRLCRTFGFGDNQSLVGRPGDGGGWGPLSKQGCRSGTYQKHWNSEFNSQSAQMSTRTGRLGRHTLVVKLIYSNDATRLGRNGRSWDDLTYR